MSEPKRIIRYCRPEAFMAGNIVATLDVGRNILFVNKELFDQLDPPEQKRVLWTEERVVELTTV